MSWRTRDRGRRRLPGGRRRASAPSAPSSRPEADETALEVGAPAGALSAQLDETAGAFTGRGPVGGGDVGRRCRPRRSTSTAAALGPALAPAVADIPVRVYVPNSGAGTVSVIDPATFAVVDRFAVGKVPHHVTPSWDLSRAVRQQHRGQHPHRDRAPVGQADGDHPDHRPLQPLLHARRHARRSWWPSATSGSTSTTRRRGSSLESVSHPVAGRRPRRLHRRRALLPGQHRVQRPGGQGRHRDDGAGRPPHGRRPAHRREDVARRDGGSTSPTRADTACRSSTRCR